MKFFKYRLKKKSESKGKDLRVVSARTSFWKPILLLLPAISILILFTIIPFVYTIQDGFHFKGENDFSLLSKGKFGISAFKKVAEDPFFIEGIKNSVYYALIAVPVILIISAIIASEFTFLPTFFLARIKAHITSIEIVDITTPQKVVSGFLPV